MLTLDPVVQVNISVGSGVVPSGVFNVGAILGPSSVLSASRFAEYANADALKTAGFAATSPEYLAAVKYFSTNPAPNKLVVIYYETDPVASAYDSSKTYDVGDYCTNNTKIWRCSTAITVAEAWNSEHWTEVTPTEETPATALADAISKGAEFYGVYYCPTAEATASAIATNIVAIDTYLNAISRCMQFYGVVGTTEAVTADSAMFATMKAANSERALGMKCATEANDAAGLMGQCMGYALKYKDSSFAIAYKAIPSATVDSLTQAQIETIHGVYGNVYVARTKQHNCFERGVTGSGLRFDEVLYLDRISTELQEACFSLIAESDQKLPLADSSTTLFISAINRVLEQYYNAGVLETNPWRGRQIGEIETGDVIEHGYTAFADSFDTQSAEDRAARKAMPITILLCLAGSVETIVLYVNVQT